MSLRKYKSKYSNGKTVSAAQYITEIICENKARNNNQDLHYKFWTTKEWAQYYRNQIASANKLLLKYSDISIVKALQKPEAKKIYSLRAPHLIPIIEQEEKILAQRNDTLSINLDRKDSVNFKKEKVNNNIISKLRGLDDES
jgi:hypothetical protein